jgi:hypothetical protein
VKKSEGATAVMEEGLVRVNLIDDLEAGSVSDEQRTAIQCGFAHLTRKDRVQALKDLWSRSERFSRVGSNPSRGRIESKDVEVSSRIL